MPPQAGVPRRALAIGPIDVATAVAALAHEHAQIRQKRQIGDWIGEIVSISVHRSKPLIDITSCGDNQRIVVEGLPETTIEIEAVVGDCAEICPDLGEDIDFDHIIGGQRICGKMILTDVSVTSEIGSLTMAHIRALATQPFTVEDVDQPGDELGRRGIALQGLP